MKFIRERIIPILLIENGRLIKTKKFTNPTYLGDPLNALRIFNEKCADEIVIIDKSNSPINLELLDRMVDEAFMPLSYIGGIRELDNFESIFSLGIEKVGVNSLLFNDISIVNQAVERWGSSSIFSMVDFRDVKEKFVNIEFSRTKKNIEIARLVDMINLAGIGELILQNVNHEGTFFGLSDDLLTQLKENINIPIVVSGGANSIEDCLDFISKHKISGVAAGSLFSFYGNRKAVLINYDYA